MNKLIGMGLVGMTLALVAVGACSNDVENVAPVTSCTAGQAQGCVGDQGCSGFQLCAADGMSFGACECGTGGSGATGTGTGNTGTGGSGNVGNSGTGGSGNVGNSGTGGTATGGSGTGGTDPDCPVSAPTEGTDCADVAWSWCTYDTDQCLCLFDQWSCNSCPVDQPANDDPCTGSGGAPDRCAYGDTQCLCAQQHWMCSTCPDAEPTDGAACTERGVICDYAATVCMCMQGEWNCQP